MAYESPGVPEWGVLGVPVDDEAEPLDAGAEHGELRFDEEEDE